MLTARSVKTWSWLHKWSSLVCTAFMLLLCLTGLPLIFHHEIGHLTGVEVEAPKMPKGTPHLSLDRVLEVARARHPDCVVQFSSPDDESPDIWFVTLTPTPAPTDDFRSVAVDARTGQVLAQPRFDQGFMWVMLKLHVDLFAGLAGKLFLGLMGLLLLVAIVSGVVLYAPFMRKLAFGEVRRDRSSRVKWLDLHNLLGHRDPDLGVRGGRHRHDQHLGRPAHQILAVRPADGPAGTVPRAAHRAGSGAGLGAKIL
jgi:uncharacterized iron-regulated membrane protein